MSSKQELQRMIVSVLKTLPKERLTHYSSFKQTQLERFQDSKIIDNISEEDLKLQYIALRALVNDKYKNYYKLDDKLLKPKGNPEYYDRLLKEIKGDGKETLLTAMRTVVFGK
ncbi:Cytochrome B pre-mRNA-processing protein 6 [Spathaspora sp. JA1]|nr:Cytochrome B pre-mRNA-processing protein 6 [Spathaspora sp. JA1]